MWNSKIIIKQNYGFRRTHTSSTNTEIYKPVLRAKGMPSYYQKYLDIKIALFMQGVSFLICQSFGLGRWV